MQFKNYTLTSSRRIEEIGADCYCFRHATGFRLIVAECPKSNVHHFEFSFRTIPFDNTGCPHVLEHLVLSGSQKFPIKEPLEGLLKLMTSADLNAATAPTRTYYYGNDVIYSNYLKSYEVYLDSVFRPLLLKEAFWTEGVCIHSPKGKKAKSVSGVVFNEMKAIDLDLFNRESRMVVDKFCSGTRFANCPGGVSTDIVELTHDDILSYYQSTYTASNGTLFLWGSGDFNKEVSMLEEYLAAFPTLFDSPNSKDEEWDNEWKKVRDIEPGSTFRQTCLASEEETDATLNLTYAFPSNQDDKLGRMKMLVLEAALLTNASSPLYKSLSCSPYGKSVSNLTGYSQYVGLWDTFTVGLDGVSTRKVKSDRYVSSSIEWIQDELKRIASRGIDRMEIEGVFTSLSIGKSLMSLNSLGYKRLKAVVFSLFAKWWQPFDEFVTTADIDLLEKEWHTDPKMFDRLFRERLCESSPKCVFICEPSARLGKETQLLISHKAESLPALTEGEEKRLSTYKQRLDPQVFQTLVTCDEMASYFRANEIEDSKDCSFPLGRKLLESSGLVEFYLNFVLPELSQREWGILELFIDAFESFSHPVGMDYTAFNQRISALTPTYSVDFHHVDSHPSGRAVKYITISAVCDGRGLGGLLQLIAQLISHPDFAGEKAGWKSISDLVPYIKSEAPTSGVKYCLCLSHALSRPQEMTSVELAEGISELDFLSDLESKFSPRCEEELENEFRVLAAKVFAKENLRAFYTSDQVRDTAFSTFYDSLPSSTVSLGSAPPTLSLGQLSQVKEHGIVKVSRQMFTCYTNLANWKVPSFMNPASFDALASILKHGELWHVVRQEIGAYGADIVHSVKSSEFEVISFRDPQVERTFDAFQKSLSSPITKEDCEDARLNSLGLYAKQLRSSYSDHSRYLNRKWMSGDNDEVRREYLSCCRSFTIDDVLAGRDFLLSTAPVCKVSFGPVG